MKTEDDTFRVLSQKSYQDVKRKLCAEIRRNPDLVDSEKKTEKFLLKFGWTIDELSNRMTQENENKTLV